jgi:hypothetical protein
MMQNYGKTSMNQPKPVISISDGVMLGLSQLCHQLRVRRTARQ